MNINHENYFYIGKEIMLKIKFFVFIIICISIFSCFSDNTTMKIDKIGIMLEYPSEMIIDNANIRKKPVANNKELENKYGIYLAYEKIENSETLAWLGLNSKDEVLKKLNKKQGSVFFRNVNSTHDFFKHENKIIGEEQLSSSTDFVFSYMLYFIKGEYFIVLEVSYFDPFRKMQKKYPQYFEYRQDDTYWWKNANEVFRMIMNGDKDAPEELIRLYDYFQQIKDSIKFY